MSSPPTDPRINLSSRRASFALYSLWTLFSLLLVVVGVQDNIANPAIRWWQPLLWEGSSAVFFTFWIIYKRRTAWRYREYLDRPALWIGQQIKSLPLLVVAFIVIVYSVRHGVYALVGLHYTHEPWWFVVMYETFKLAMFSILWLGVLFGFDSFEQWQQQRENLLTTQKALVEAQLLQLKAQLRPHFLFNALNTISSLMHTDVEHADRLLAQVGELLRISLQTDGKQFVSLRDELHVLRLYAQIMQDRFGDRLTLLWNVDEGISEASLPSFLLQPLLENAFKHGVERSVKPEQVRFTASRVTAGQDLWQLRVVIVNTGSTLKSADNGGIGLRNCRERLRVLFGDRSSLELKENSAGVEVSLTLPYIVHAP